MNQNNSIGRDASSRPMEKKFCWSRRRVVTNGIKILLVATSRRNQWNKNPVGRDETCSAGRHAARQNPNENREAGMRF
jgi:hypothetical protein